MTESARASRAGSAFGRLGAAAATNPVPTGTPETPRHPDVTTPRHPDTATPRRSKVEPVSRFTVRFYDQRDVDNLDQWLLAAKRQFGHKIDKADVVRQLLRLVVDDPALTARLYERLGETP